MYYNTTSEKGLELKYYEESSLTQDERIYNVFKSNMGIEYGCSDLYKIFKSMPLTSIRRALNTLEADGKIAKTGRKQRGIYSRNENTYKIK